MVQFEAEGHRHKEGIAAVIAGFSETSVASSLSISLPPPRTDTVYGSGISHWGCLLHKLLLESMHTGAGTEALSTGRLSIAGRQRVGWRVWLISRGEDWGGVCAASVLCTYAVELPTRAQHFYAG